MSTHGMRSPSKCGRIRLCPGSVHIMAQYPQQGPSSPAAKEGTHDHTLLEHYIRGSVWDALTMVGIQLEDKEGPFEVTEDRAGRVQMALDYVAKRLPELGPSPMLWSELKVDPGQKEGYPGWNGSADIVLFDQTTRVLEVIDYKGGFGNVEPDSDQNLSYLEGAVDYLCPDGSLSEMRSTIIQPKNGGVKSITFPDMMAFQFAIQPLLRALDISMDPNAPRVAGESQCRYCTGALEGRCPEYVAWRTGNLETVFANVPMPPAIVVVEPSSTPASIQEYSPELIRQILDARAIVKGWLDEVEAEALRRFQKGEPIPEHKVVYGRPTTKWAHGEAETAKRLGNMHLKKALWTKETLRTPKQVLALPETKKWSERKRKNLEALSIEIAGALKVVPSTEKGTPVEFDPVEVFKDLPDPNTNQVEAPVNPEPDQPKTEPEAPALSFL